MHTLSIIAQIIGFWLVASVGTAAVLSVVLTWDRNRRQPRHVRGRS